MSPRVWPEEKRRQPSAVAWSTWGLVYFVAPQVTEVREVVPWAVVRVRRRRVVRVVRESILGCLG